MGWDGSAVMHSVGIVVATFGTSEWEQRGIATTDMISVMSDVDDVVHVHDKDNLCVARNCGAASLGTDYVVFLDADDSLQDDYISVMKQCIEPGQILYKPSTVGVHMDGSKEEPSMIERSSDFTVRNELVVGTGMPLSEDIFFDPTLPSLEDWELFLRLIILGYSIKECPSMVYKVHLNEMSRNSPDGTHHRTAGMIRNKYRHHSPLKPGRRL